MRKLTTAQMEALEAMTQHGFLQCKPYVRGFRNRACYMTPDCLLTFSTRDVEALTYWGYARVVLGGRVAPTDLGIETARGGEGKGGGGLGGGSDLFTTTMVRGSEVREE